MEHSDEILEILELMREHGLVELELERADFKIRLKKGAGAGAVVATATGPDVTGPAVSLVPAVPAPTDPSAAATTDEAPVGVELAVVKSPIVGTFYRAPEPGAANFVEVGDQVRKGQVLCIVEAMKLMNEIESEFDGEIAATYADNGMPVQYGERLFAIKPA